MKLEFNDWKNSLGLAGEYLASSSWSLGSEGRSWTGDTWSHSAEESKEFIEFDELMEKIDPDMKILQYRKIKNHCVFIVRESWSDYYGHGAHAEYRLNFQTLYDFLVENYPSLLEPKDESDS